MRILREMAKEATGQTGINYASFKCRLNGENLMKGQNGPLKMRLQLLESFRDLPGLRPAKETDSDLWDFKSGTLTIVDLSCPFVAENDACALFNICLSLFLERRHQGGRLVALDEAHKVSILHRMHPCLPYRYDTNIIIIVSHHEFQGGYRIY
jgi:hypothetical protein